MSRRTNDRPRRVLFVDHAVSLGGAEHSLLLILRFLDRNRWEPHLAGRPGPLLEAAASLGIPVHAVPMAKLRGRLRGLFDWLAGGKGLSRLAQDQRIDLFHANTVRAAFYAALAARLARRPWIWHVRDHWLSEARPRRPWLDLALRRLLCRAATRVIAVSRSVASRLHCEDKLTIVYNGLDPDEFRMGVSGQANLFRTRFGIPGDAPLVGTLGRLRPWKGQDRFLRAMKPVAEADPAARFLVVGGDIFGLRDDYPDRLRRLAHDLGLAGRVTFTGHLADVRPALGALDILVQAGEPEPFGLVNIEAMAMSVPLIAYHHGAVPELLDDSGGGLLVPPGDEAALGQAVLDLLGDPGARSRMGAAGRTRVETHFTAARMAEKVGTVFRAVLGWGLDDL